MQKNGHALCNGGILIIKYQNISFWMGLNGPLNVKQSVYKINTNLGDIYHLYVKVCVLKGKCSDWAMVGHLC